MNFLKKIFHKDNYIPKQRVMVVGGCFDILHKGHLDFLRNAKKHCDKLIIFLEPDESIKRLKGNDRPVNNAKVRAINLQKTKIIDQKNDLIIILPPLKTDSDYFNFISEIQTLNKNWRISFGITKNDKNTKKNKNIIKLGEKMKIKIIEVNQLLPDYSTSRLVTN